MIGAWLMMVGVVAAVPDETSLHRYEYSQIQMAAQVKVIFYAPDEATANAAAVAVYARFKQLNAIMSDYDPDSELSKLSRSSPAAQGVPVSDDLWRVLSYAKKLSERSDGSFDVTVGPLVKLWRRSRRNKELPPPDLLKAARAATGYQYMQLDPVHHAVRLTQPGMLLDLGGIAMGDACDQTLLVLKKFGITRAMIDGSGDVIIGDAPPGKPGWRIGIAPLDSPDGMPQHFVILKNAAITTSGDAFQFVEIDGKRYSHIVDPRTGVGLTDHSSVTVIASECITADSMTKPLSVLGPDAGMKLIEATPGAAAFVERKPNGKLETYASKRFHAFEAPAEK